MHVSEGFAPSALATHTVPTALGQPSKIKMLARGDVPVKEMSIPALIEGVYENT
jgi:hypothetical protein